MLSIVRVADLLSYFRFKHLNVHISLYTANNYVPPTLHLPDSLFRVQETDQIVIRAEIRSPTEQVSSAWHHGDTSYSKPLREDPFCNPGVEVSVRESVDSIYRDGNNMPISLNK